MNRAQLACVPAGVFVYDGVNAGQFVGGVANVVP
jgi:hypothetical protein